MRFQRIASTALTLLLSSVAVGIAQEGTSITWESYKEAEFNFGDNLLRVGSEYQTYSWATDAPTGWTSSYGPEFTEITSQFTTDYTSSQVSSPRATSSAVAGWLLDKDDSSGIATLSNAAAGTTTIIDKYDPTATAMSWAAQSTTLELGEEVSQGQIDWSPGILVSASGGAFVSSYDTITIHDPIVVWTRDANSDVVQRSTVFELTAEFDSKTEIHWNEVREIRTGILGEPEFVPVPNDGPFLDAAGGGTGSFRLRLDSELLAADKRGTLAVDFKDGIVTTSTATGVFSELAPREDALGTTLPEVGSPAIIDSILVDNDNTNGRFALSVDVGQDRVISDVAACSDGVHISVGPAIDTIQTFTLNPMQRSPVSQFSTRSEDNGLPGACLGELREDADLLFGNPYSSSANATLQPESRTNPIDRFLRLDVAPDGEQQTIIFEKGENSSPAETRRWKAEFDVRMADLSGKLPTEPIGTVPIEDAVAGATGVGQQPTIDEESATGVIGVIDPIRARYAIGLLDAGGIAAAATTDEGDVVTEQDISLFRKAEGVVLIVTDRQNKTVARLVVDGSFVAEANIPRPDQGFFIEDRWQHFELGLEQQHVGMDIQLNLLNRNGDAILSVIEETIPNERMSADGYRLAIGSLMHEEDLVHDFDNLTMTFQQAGDVAWDGIVDVDDFRLLSHAIETDFTDSIFDVDLNGQIDFADLEIVEDLIPNKLPGDTNLDGMVDFADFLVLADFFGESTGLWSRGDFDSNGRVAFKDFVLLAQNYGLGSEGNAQPVPEPRCMTILLLGMLALGRVRVGVHASACSSSRHAKA